MSGMKSRLGSVVRRLNASVDWFVPAHYRESRNILQAVRMFLMSHLCGPILGHVITLSMLFLGAKADASWWILFLSISAFWLYPFALKLTDWYVPLSLLSIQNLLFCIFWGCYQYGGISSPILPWLVTVPLLGFFYLPERSTRITVSALIVVNLSVFFAVYSAMGFHESAVEPHSLVVLGLVSTLSASAYVSMMALYFASIASSQGELEHEIQTNQETERKLRDATSEARRALMAKSEYLAKMSHELRNPLNAIIGYSEILIEDTDKADAQKCQDLTSIRSAGHRLLGLINDLLELSRLEAGKVPLRVEEFDLAPFLEGLAGRAATSVADSGNVLVVEPFPSGRIACDVNKLTRVIEGLLSNAAKFTSQGRITMSASLEDDTWMLAIRDNGVGIAASQMATLFETFGRPDNESARRYGDEVRLGLPLASRYCQLMGGELRVQSEPGQGSTVTVVLPRRTPGWAGRGVGNDDSDSDNDNISEPHDDETLQRLAA